MRGTMIVLLVIALLLLIGAAFFITNPEAGQQLLVDLGLATPAAEAGILAQMVELQDRRLAGVWRSCQFPKEIQFIKEMSWPD